MLPYISGLMIIIALVIGSAPNLTAALLTNFGYGDFVRGTLEDAEQWFELATRVDNGSFAAWHGLGQVFTKQGTTVFALQAYDRALFLHPDHVQARLDRAKARLLLGDKDGAIRDWETAGSVDALLWLGHQAQADDFEVAELFYQLAVQVAPQDWRGFYYLGAMLKNQMLFDDAEHILLAGLDVSSDNSSILFRLGQTQCAQQHYEDALRSFSRYIELAPDDFRGWYWRGICWEETGALDQASHDFQKAVVLNSDDPNLQIAITRVLELTGGK